MEERFKTFTVLISTINRNIKRIKSEEMDEFNLKSPHVSCLYYLYTSDSLSAKELCDICGEDKASISRSLEFLENNGYLVCDTTQKKRYRSQLMLTEKGQAIAKLISDKIDRILEFASDGLSNEKRKSMYEGLTLISNNLENLCKNYKEIK